jgi:flagellar basal body-associated protein FliL
MDSPATPDIGQLIIEWTKVSDATAKLTLKNRKAIMWLKMIVVIGVVLLVSVIVLFFLYRDASQQANASRCEAGNDYRAADKETWDFVFGLSSTAPQTPEQAANTLKFKEFINEKNKPLEC